MVRPIKVSSTGPVYLPHFTLIRIFYLNILAENARFTSHKRLREPFRDDAYDSNEYLLFDNYECSSSCSGAISSEVDETDRGSNSSMDMSDSNDPSLLTAKDGTKWKEFLPVDNPRPGFSPQIVNHIPKVTAMCDNRETPIVNVTFLYSLVFLSHLYIFLYTEGDIIVLANPNRAVPAENMVASSEVSY